MSKTEDKLADIATFHDNDEVASRAMKILRKRYNPNYFWCSDCDGLVVKSCDCYDKKNMENIEF